MHLPPEQLPPQHWPFEVHASLSAMHCVEEHTLPSQRTEQQSVFALQDEPPDEHVVVLTAQLPVESHTPEQHIVPSEQGVPNTPHGLLASGMPLPFLLLPHAANKATRQTGSHQLVLILVSSPIRMRW